MMAGSIHNSGSGTISISGSAIGPNGTVYNTTVPTALPQPAPSLPSGRRADIGVITVLSEETHALVELLGQAPSYQKHEAEGGGRFHEARLPVGGREVRVIAAQALDRGQRSAVLAYGHLRRFCAPPLVVLLGVAGAIHPLLDIDDVVVADEVICYDPHRVGATEVHRRGQVRAVPAVVRHMVNDFFSAYGEPLRLPGSGADFGVRRGPIGSGEAVVTRQDAEVRRYLTGFNEKTLAVETEAGGVAQAFYEEVDADPGLRGWLVVRGISDHADPAKTGDHRASASRHAAQVLLRLLPFLASGLA